MDRIRIPNVEIDNVSMEELLAQLKRGMLVTPNVDQIVKMQSDKEFYDIPSLMGYLSLMLLIYKMGAGVINRFFEWASSFSYELYLVHSLVLAVMAYFLKGALPLAALLAVSLVTAYAVGYGYSRILKTCRLK